MPDCNDDPSTTEILYMKLKIKMMMEKMEARTNNEPKEEENEPQPEPEPEPEMPKKRRRKYYKYVEPVHEAKLEPLVQYQNPIPVPLIILNTMMNKATISQIFSL